eukprot:10891895-Heterocapsa_arctica.AAC.1
MVIAISVEYMTAVRRWVRVGRCTGRTLACVRGTVPPPGEFARNPGESFMNSRTSHPLCACHPSRPPRGPLMVIARMPEDRSKTMNNY